MILRRLCSWTLGCAFAAMEFAAFAAETNALPNYQDVVRLIRVNLPGVTEAEINHALVSGVLDEFRPRVLLTTKDSAGGGADSTAVASTNIYNGEFAYVRLKGVTHGVDEQLATTIRNLGQPSPVKGLILDLRFATGADYEAAARTADHFAATEQPLLDWGNGLISSTTKTNALILPTVILVNGETAGAAEALAAMLRELRVGVLIGSATAGQASNYKEFELPEGRVLRIATGDISLGGKGALTSEGVTPDVVIRVSREDERAYLNDPFKAPPRKESAASKADGTNSVANAAPRRRFNEAELVRLQREGKDPEEEFADAASAPEPPPDKPYMRDPALGRAIDLLKGLALVRRSDAR